MTDVVAHRVDVGLHSVRRRIRDANYLRKWVVLPGSALAGRQVSEVAWPRESVLVSIERDGALLVPRGDLQLQQGNHRSIFATPAPGPGGQSP